MDTSPPSSISSPASGGENAPPVKLTPVMMHGLLAAGAPASPVRLAWEPPSVEALQRLMPQYEILAFIARGGMGAVYKGVHRTLQRPVAIKVLPPEADTGGMNHVERFKRETQAMARLNHPNIVSVYDAGEVPSASAESGRSPEAGGTESATSLRLISRERAGGRAGSLLYFVMEYVEGTDVQQLIAAEGRLDALRAAQIICSVCQALAYAHDEGIIHRDIKPSNILIDRKGHVKVADFGLAKSLNADGTIVTRSDVALGSPDFVAPEALLGLALDQRADIYAVGVMLYQMLTGRIPRGSYDAPSQIVPELGKRFDAIVSKAMQTHRDLRYRTSAELKHALAKAMPDLHSWDVITGSHRSEIEGGHRGMKKSMGLAVAAALLGFGAGAFVLRPTLPPLVKAHVSKPAAFSTDGLRTVPDGPSNESTTPVSRRWRRITFQQDEFLGDGGAIVMPDGSLKLSRGVEFNQFIPCRNMAVKARARRSLGADISGIRLRIKGTPEVSLYTEGARAWLDTENVLPPHVPDGALKLPSGSPEAVSLLLVVIDRRAYGFVDGVALPPLDLESRHSVGSAGIWSSNGVFSDVNFIPLDGLSEADALSISGVTSHGG